MAPVRLTLAEAQVIKALADHHKTHSGLAAQLDDLEYLPLGRGQLIKVLRQLINKKLVSTERKQYHNPPSKPNEYFLTVNTVSFSVNETVNI